MQFKKLEWSTEGDVTRAFTPIGPYTILQSEDCYILNPYRHTPDQDIQHSRSIDVLKEEAQRMFIETVKDCFVELSEG